MASFPSTLPRPQRSGYSLSPVSAVKRTEMDSGTARSRRRFRSTPTAVTLSWLFTMGQFAVFEAWWEHVANAGASWVDMPIANGLGVNTISARFIGVSKPVMEGTLYRVTATVEARALPILTPEQLEAVSVFSPDDLASGSALLHATIHNTWPGYW